MCKITLVLACLACTSAAWRVQSSATSPTHHTVLAEALKHSRAAAVSKAFGEDDAQKKASITVNEFFDPHFGESRRKRDVVYGMFNKVADHAGRQKNKLSNALFLSADDAPPAADVPTRDTATMDWFDDMLKDKSMMKKSQEGASPERTKIEIAKELLKNFADKKLGADYLRIKAEEAEAEMNAREEWIKKQLAPAA